MTSWYSALKMLLGWGVTFWFRVLGPKRAPKFLIAGLVGSVIAALILEETL